jgi:undecaprenyl pyrophosphate synthase
MLFPQKTGKDQKKEISFLFDLLKKFLKNKLTKLNQQNIKLKFIGERNLIKK